MTFLCPSSPSLSQKIISDYTSNLRFTSIFRANISQNVDKTLGCLSSLSFHPLNSDFKLTRPREEVAKVFTQ